MRSTGLGLAVVVLGLMSSDPFLGGVAEKDAELAGRQGRSIACVLKGRAGGGTALHWYFMWECLWSSQVSSVLV